MTDNERRSLTRGGAWSALGERSWAADSRGVQYAMRGGPCDLLVSSLDQMSPFDMESMSCGPVPITKGRNDEVHIRLSQTPPTPCLPLISY